MRRSNDTKKEFMEKNFVVCPYCHYNNEKNRFYQFGTCLKCSKIIDEKVYFTIEMRKRILNNKRKSR